MVCGVVSMMVGYWLKENMGLFVVDKNGLVLRLDIDSSMVECAPCRVVKEK